MKRPFLTVTLPVCLTIVIAIGYFATAGDLNPPAGAVSGTMKTLVDVEPRIAINATNTPGDADSLFRIAQRGSYRGNTSTSNGVGGDGAGIRATGADNRIEDNNCTGADRGIDVDAAGNVIIRNTCSGNTTDWVVVANNVVGPILDRRAPASAAINGFAAPDSTGSTHPNANFSY